VTVFRRNRQRSIDRRDTVTDIPPIHIDAAAEQCLNRPDASLFGSFNKGQELTVLGSLRVRELGWDIVGRNVLIARMRLTILPLSGGREREGAPPSAPHQSVSRGSYHHGGRSSWHPFLETRYRTFDPETTAHHGDDLDLGIERTRADPHVRNVIWIVQATAHLDTVTAPELIAKRVSSRSHRNATPNALAFPIGQCGAEKGTTPRHTKHLGFLSKSRPRRLRYAG
jgi:hypothetical protein